MTLKQRNILKFFRERARERMPPPTYRDLCTRFGWRSTGTARDHLKALARDGWIEKAADSGDISRNWRLTRLADVALDRRQGRSRSAEESNAVGTAE